MISVAGVRRVRLVTSSEFRQRFTRALSALSWHPSDGSVNERISDGDGWISRRFVTSTSCTVGGGLIRQTCNPLCQQAGSPSLPGLHTTVSTHHHTHYVSYLSTSASANIVPNPIISQPSLEQQTNSLESNAMEVPNTNQPRKSSKKHKRQKSGGSSKHNNDTGNITIPKQSSHTTRILYQSIAPHVETRTLLQLTKQLTKMISLGHHPHLDTLDRGGKKRTLKRRLDMFFEDGDSSTKQSTKNNAQYSWSVKGHPWIKSIIYQYLMGKLLDYPAWSIDINNKKVSAKPLPYQTEPSYPPNQNRQQYNRHLKTLLRAQKASILFPIFWTDKSMRDAGYNTLSAKDIANPEKKQYSQKLHRLHSAKDESQLQLEAEVTLELLVERLPPPHFDKLMAALEGYAKLQGQSSGSKESGGDENSWLIEEENKPLKAIGVSAADWKKHRISVLGKFLNTISASHSHLVAVDLARFFYVDVPTPPSVSGGNNATSGSKSISVNSADSTKKKQTPSEKLEDVFEENVNKEESSEGVNAQKHAFAIKKHNKLHSADKKYQKTREDFVKKMMQLQHDFVAWKEELAIDRSVSGRKEANDLDVIDNGDVSADLMVGEFQKEQSVYNADTRQKQQESLAETLVELQKLGLRNGEESGLKKRRGRPKKGEHVSSLDLLGTHAAMPL